MLSMKICMKISKISTYIAHKNKLNDQYGQLAVSNELHKMRKPAKQSERMKTLTAAGARKFRLVSNNTLNKGIGD